MERTIDTNIFMKKPNPTPVVEEPVHVVEEDIMPNIDVDNLIGNSVEHTPDSSSDASINVTEVTVTSVKESATESKETASKEVKYDRGDGSVDVIKLKNLTHIFNKGQENEYKLFENFNMTIPDIPGVGQLVSIMGASGCGKSRLVRAICGLDDIQNGEILIYDKPIAEYGKNIPLVFQTYSNFEWKTVIENVMLPMIIKGVDKDIAEKKAMKLLELVGLAEHANKYPHKMSGGQQQRISIARSLACQSQIICFDEATSALDIKMKRETQSIILKIFYETKEDPTILNITHSIEEAAYISNKVIILKPNPCTIYKEIDIHYTGEETRHRGEWIFETDEYANYVKEITTAMDEVCK